MNNQPYLYGKSADRRYPLQDFLPPYRIGLVSSWLSDQVQPGSLVLCPFGSSPQVALEAARAGYRILLPIHNPILRFLIEILADPPSWEELNSGLVTLASSYKGRERLKPFLLSLYETDCPLCGAKTSALSFRWDRASRELVSKTCRCSSCGEESSGPVTAEDIQKGRGFSERSPIFARALTRVAAPSDPIRFQVEKALGSYPPRSVYALFTVLNKLTGLDRPEVELDRLKILLLHAFQRCSHPLALPSSGEDASQADSETYQEENVWYAIEDALSCWTGEGPTVQVSIWPDLPPDRGGVSIYPGRVKEFIPHLADQAPQAAVMVFPRPTPSFWGLSALWTGWLWGQEAAAPLRGVLSIRTYDWPWMTRAVKSTLMELGQVLPQDTPLLGLIPEADSSSVISGIGASLTAGMMLDNYALDPDQLLVQTRWRFRGSPSPSPEGLSIPETIRKAGLDLLLGSGEPRHSLAIYGAGLSSLAEAGLGAGEGQPDPEQVFSQLLKDFEENIAYRQGFLHFPEQDTWWHLELDLDPLPHSDRVEMSLVRLLIQSEGALPEKEIQRALSAAYPALDTPRSGLLEACLASYGQGVGDEDRAWTLKPNEKPANRLQDLEEIAAKIEQIGAGLGYASRRALGPEGAAVLTWLEGDVPLDSFFLSASALLSRMVTHPASGAIRNWIILPGSRAGLVHYKMDQNPVLSEALQEKWGLLKFRHIRHLAEQGDLSRENIQERLILDPFTSDSPQLLLI